MKKYQFTIGYTFDDVLLIPKYSSVRSRDDIDLSVQLPKNILLKTPIVSANMKNVTGANMAIAIANIGGLPILHRFDTFENIKNTYLYVSNTIKDFDQPHVGISLGIHEQDKQIAKDFYNLGCKIMCVDVAHAHNKYALEFVDELRYNYPEVLIIAGNVSTVDGAQALWEAGAHVIKVGQGAGSLCSTRIETGNGYPQLSAIQLISSAYYRERVDCERPIIISDGGIKEAGDCVKALAFADLVMLGNMLAGTTEAPGDIIVNNNIKYKQYAGSSTHKQKHIEGVIALVPFKGPVANVIQKILDGLTSGLSYQGVSNLVDLKTDPEFVVITNAGLRESHPHDIISL